MPKIIEIPAKAHTLGSSLTFDLALLKDYGAGIGSEAPRWAIEGLVLVVTGSVTVTTSPVTDEDLWGVFERIVITDVDGDRMNCSGRGFRIFVEHQLEAGTPLSAGDIAVGGPTATTIRFPIPLKLFNGIQPTDFLLDVDTVAGPSASGAQIKITTQSPDANFAVTGLEIGLEVIIRETSPTLRPRWSLIEHTQLLQSDTVPVNGFLRSCFAHNGPSAYAVTTLQDRIVSTALDYSSYSSALLRNEYDMAHLRPQVADSLISGESFADFLFYVPNTKAGRKNSDAVKMINLDFRDSLPATTGNTLVTFSIIPRSVNFDAIVLRVSPEAVEEVVDAQGALKDAAPERWADGTAQASAWDRTELATLRVVFPTMVEEDE